MFRIQFFVGLPHASPRQEVATAITMHDDADKAFSEAKQKAMFIQNLLTQQTKGYATFQPPVEDDRDYIDGRLSAEACQRLKDEQLLSLMGPHPLPSRDVKTHLPPPVIELQLTSDDGQITLIDVPKVQLGLPKETNGWHPSGDYQATILLKFGSTDIGIGDLQFAATTASRALSMATERARVLVAELKKEPKLRFLQFKDIKIHVERVNTQTSLVEEEPDFDWQRMEFPAPHF